MPGLISNHSFKFDYENIQDTFISHLNHSAEIQKQVNHDQASSVPNIKLFYLAGLYIHTIGGITASLESTHHANNFPSKYSSCPNFHSRATNAIFEDHAGFDTVDAHLEFFDYENQLNALEANLNFTDFHSLWNYAFHGIDLEGVTHDAVNALKCAICGGVGHNFANCPRMER